MKIHVVGDYRPGTLPLPRSIGVTPAGMNDGPAVEIVAPALAYRELYADQAYEYLTRNANLPFTVLTPIKKEKGQERLDSADRLYSAAVSRLHQPVESPFNWIQEKTGIECASKVCQQGPLLSGSPGPRLRPTRRRHVPVERPAAKRVIRISGREQHGERQPG